MKLSQDCGACVPPPPCCQAYPRLGVILKPKQTTLSLRVHPLTSATPLCFLLLAELRRATSPSEVVACVQAISREPHRHCHHPAGACGPPPSAWLRIICQSAPLPSLCLPAPSPALRSLTHSLAGSLLALSLFMRCKAWRRAERSRAACCRSSSRGPEVRRPRSTTLTHVPGEG